MAFAEIICIVQQGKHVCDATSRNMVAHGKRYGNISKRRDVGSGKQTAKTFNGIEFRGYDFL